MKHKKKTKFIKKSLFIFSAFTLFSVLPSCAGKDKEEGKVSVETETESGWGKSGEAQPTEAMGEMLEEMTEEEMQDTEEPTEPVLTDIRYNENLDWDVPVWFEFSDGTIVRCQSVYEVRDVKYLDMTGDGVDEVLLEGSFNDGKDVEYLYQSYHSTLSVFQINGSEVKELSFAEDIAELNGKVCEVQAFELDRGGRKGNALHVRAYTKENTEYNVENEMDIFYEDGKWIKLPKRKYEPEISLGSASEEGRAYEAFLRGECKAGVSEDCYNDIRYIPYSLDFNNGSKEEFYFQDILEAVISDARADTYWPVDGVESVEYGLIDCGSDGKLELVVQVWGVHIYSQNDDSSVMMVFRNRDGIVELIYAVNTWARSWTHINSDGSIGGEGSGGATLHGLEEGKIGADGVYREAYDMQIGSGQKVGDMEPCYAFQNEDFSPTFYQCKIEGEIMYAYVISEETPEKVREQIMEYIAENEKSLGLTFMTYEEMDALCDAQRQKLDISDYYDEETRISWQTLNGCEEYLY